MKPKRDIKGARASWSPPSNSEIFLWLNKAELLVTSNFLKLLLKRRRKAFSRLPGMCADFGFIRRRKEKDAKEWKVKKKHQKGVLYGLAGNFHNQI